MVGFGATMTESAAAVIMGSRWRDAILDDLFLPQAAGGAGLSCLRVPIGSCDFGLSPPGAATHQDDEERPFDASRDDALLVPALRQGIRSKSELTRRSFVMLVAMCAKRFPGVHALHGDLFVLCDLTDPESDFFNNIVHLQLHRRKKALERLTRICEGCAKEAAGDGSAGG